MGWGNLGRWGNLDDFLFLLISLKQNGLTVGAACMDCISPLTSEMSTAGFLDVREERGISAGISKFFLLKLNFLKR